MYPAITLCGMRRSGNHAIIGWLLRGTDWYHLNNVAYNLALRKVNVKQYDEDGKFIRLVDHPLPPLDKLLQSQEERPVMYDGAYVLLRSVYNVFASRLARPQQGWPITEEALDLWCDHAESVNRKILFDDWLVSREYRTWLAGEIGLGSPELLQHVNSDGGGSSFTKTRPLNHADLAERWRQIDVPDFVLASRRARRLMYAHFGWALNEYGEYYALPKRFEPITSWYGEHSSPRDAEDASESGTA